MLTRVRSAITGRFVKKRRASTAPRTTVTESRPWIPAGYVQIAVLFRRCDVVDEAAVGWVGGEAVDRVAVLLSPRVAREYAHALRSTFPNDARFKDDAMELERAADRVGELAREEPLDA